jgi:hypothetical protein
MPKSSFPFVHNTDAYDGIIDFAEQNNSDIILTIIKAGQNSFYLMLPLQ